MGIHHASCPMFPVLQVSQEMGAKMMDDDDGVAGQLGCVSSMSPSQSAILLVRHRRSSPMADKSFLPENLFKVVCSCWLIKLLVVHVVGDMGSQGLLKSQRITCGPCLPDSVYLHSVYYKYGNGARSVISTSKATRSPPEYAQRQWLPPRLDVSSASPRW